MNQENEYLEGKQAFIDGKPMDSCPYPPETTNGKRYNFLMGFMDEKFAKWDYIEEDKYKFKIENRISKHIKCEDDENVGSTT